MEVKHNMSKLTMDDFGEILGSYMAEPGWSKLCLLLDYDGTLAPHGSHPDLTVRDRREVHLLLGKALPARICKRRGILF